MTLNHPFAAQANASAPQLNADLRHFVKYLADSEKYKAIVAESNYTLKGEVSLGGGEKHWHRKIHNAQNAIRKFVRDGAGTRAMRRGLQHDSCRRETACKSLRPERRSLVQK